LCVVCVEHGAAVVHCVSCA